MSQLHKSFVAYDCCRNGSLDLAVFHDVQFTCVRSYFVWFDKYANATSLPACFLIVAEYLLVISFPFKKNCALLGGLGARLSGGPNKRSSAYVANESA